MPSSICQQVNVLASKYPISKSLTDQTTSKCAKSKSPYKQISPHPSLRRVFIFTGGQNKKIATRDGFQMPLSRMPFPICRRPFASLSQMPSTICQLRQMPFVDICHCPFAFLWQMPSKTAPKYSALFASVTFASVRQLPLNTTHCHVDPSAIWDNCLSWHLPSQDICHSNTFAALWRLPPCDVCRPVTFAALWLLPLCDICHSVTFAALRHLPLCDFCRFRTFAVPRLVDSWWLDILAGLLIGQTWAINLRSHCKFFEKILEFFWDFSWVLVFQERL